MLSVFQLFRGAVGASLVALSLSLAGCHPLAPVLTPMQPTSEVQAQARVTLVEIDNDILKFSVFNPTSNSLVVSRDEIVLASYRGVQRREPGGVERFYTVPPGGTHAVNVRFSFAGVKAGETLEVRFDRALSINNQPIAMPPIRIRVGDGA